MEQGGAHEGASRKKPDKEPIDTLGGLEDSMFTSEGLRCLVAGIAVTQIRPICAGLGCERRVSRGRHSVSIALTMPHGPAKFRPLADDVRPETGAPTAFLICLVSIRVCL
jgi:hypothetical protein